MTAPDSTPTPASCISYAALADRCREAAEALSARARVYGSAGDRAVADRCRDLSADYARLARAWMRLPGVHAKGMEHRRNLLDATMRGLDAECDALLE